jgi:hypothetical protein
MTAWEPIASETPATAEHGFSPAFDVVRARRKTGAAAHAAGVRLAPLRPALSPRHDGRLAAGRPGLRGSEDAFVDDLIAGAPALGPLRDPRPAGPGLYRSQPRRLGAGPGDVRGRTARLRPGPHGAGGGGAGRDRPGGRRRPPDLRPQADLRRGQGADRHRPPPLSRRPGPPAGPGAQRPRPGDPGRLALDAGGGGARPPGARRRSVRHRAGRPLRRGLLGPS